MNVVGPLLAAFIIAMAGWATASAQPTDPTEPSAAQTPRGEVIVITESRRDRPLSEATVATEVISREEIESSGAENLAELLADHPGVEVFRSYRGSAIRMQGLGPAYVLVLVDGKRTIGRVGGAIDLDRFAVEDIERLEIVKGASSALYGSDALAGVVNIITRKPDGPVEAEFHSAYGSLDTIDMSGRVGGRRGAWSSSTSAGWHRSAGYDLDPSTIASTASSHDEIHVTHRTSYRLRPRLELGADAEYLRRDQAGIDESAGGAVLDRSTRTETAAAAVDLSWRPRARGVLSASGRYSIWRDQYLSDQRESDALDQYEVTREQLAEVEAQYDSGIGKRHFLSVGAQTLFETLEADRLSRPGDRYRGALFAQHEWTIATAPYIVAAPGLRVDVDSQFGQHVSPKLATRWDVTPGWVTRASYGGGFRAPGFRELLLHFENPSVGYRVVGNPDLRPESSRSANLGVEARLHARVWTSLNLFHNDIDDLIATDLMDDGGTGATQVFGYVNIASARSRGLEWVARLKALAELSLELGYTLTDTLDRETGTALPGRAMHRATTQATYRIPGAHLELRARASLYGRHLYFDGDGEVVVDPYAAVDGRCQFDPSRRLSLFVGVDNALDEGDPGLLPIPPRSFYGGLTARY